MNRTLLGFLIAPFWAPGILLTIAFVKMVRVGSVMVMTLDLPITLLVGTASYAGALIFGLPVYFVFRHIGWTSRWAAAPTGAVIGILTYLAFAMVFGVIFWGESLAINFRLLAHLVRGDVAALSLLLPATVGALSGISLWCIARPDRRPRAA